MCTIDKVRNYCVLSWCCINAMKPSFLSLRPWVLHGDQKPVQGKVCDYIMQMLIKGIRSFSPDNTHVIEFYKPLTLIVGHNGAGKTVRSRLHGNPEYLLVESCILGTRRTL